MSENISFTELLESVREDICDNFCTYRDTVDDDCKCDWIRSGERCCPLDRL